MDKILSEYVKEGDKAKEINKLQPITILSILQQTGSFSKNGCKYCLCKCLKKKFK